MFEVKGWKLSAPLKADTSKTSTRTTINDDEAPKPAAQEKSKKRKRGHGRSAGIDVTADNLADAWEQHIEGKTAKVEKQGSSEDASRSDDGVKKPFAQSSSVGKPNSTAEPTEQSGRRQKSADSKQKHHGIPNSKPAAPDSKSTLPTTSTTAPKFTALQSKMSHKLASARFRHLNQQLYTTPSNDSLSLFSSNPDMFADYHAGFAQQVEVWPENPVDSYVEDITTRGKVRGPPAGKSMHKTNGPREAKAGEVEPLPRIRDRGFQCVIADLGCGTAKIASALQPQLKKLNLKIHSFDLHAPNSLITAADIANLPLPDTGVDVAIACLALMGTNWIEFVEEAWRVLRWKGEFWVAEIKSRFSRAAPKSGTGPAHSVSKRQMKKQGLVGKAGAKKDRAKNDKENEEQLAVEVDGVEVGAKGETDVAHFVKVLERRGFVLDGVPDLTNKMFVKMRFVKAAPPTRGKHAKQGSEKTKKFVDKQDDEDFDEMAVLKPCVYKLR